MNRMSLMVLNIAAALYLFANGIFGLQKSGEFATMVTSIFKKGDFASFLIIALGICGIVAGVFILLSFFRIETPVTDLILFIFIILWVVFIVIIDIISGSWSKDFLGMLAQIATHLMVLGTLAMSTKRFAK